MSALVSASWLSGSSLGKQVAGTDRHGREFDITLTGIDHRTQWVALWSTPDTRGFLECKYVYPETPITITDAKETP